MRQLAIITRYLIYYVLYSRVKYRPRTIPGSTEYLYICLRSGYCNVGDPVSSQVQESDRPDDISVFDAWTMK